MQEKELYGGVKKLTGVKGEDGDLSLEGLTLLKDIEGCREENGGYKAVVGIGYRETPALITHVVGWVDGDMTPEEQKRFERIDLPASASARLAVVKLDSPMSARDFMMTADTSSYLKAGLQEMVEYMAKARKASSVQSTKQGLY